MINYPLRRIKETIWLSLSTSKGMIKLDRPIISFSFDDFPVSAYKVAGKILEENSLRGTYYTSMGLNSKTTDEMGKHFNNDIIFKMIEKGHEIGCHTYSHLAYKKNNIIEYLNDVDKNKKYFKEYFNQNDFTNFSYPFGLTSLQLKNKMSMKYDTCRGIFPGINNRIIDLSMLRANKLYSSSIPLKKNSNLIDKNKLVNGWLIFYTHDIEKYPSPWGCTSEYFSKIVDESLKSGAEILTVREAYKKVIVLSNIK